jgi:hypothetical protein
MTNGFQRSCGPAGSGDPEAVAVRVATLTDAESQQVLQYLAGFTPVAVDMAIAAVKALQLHRDS